MRLTHPATFYQHEIRDRNVGNAPEITNRTSSIPHGNSPNRTSFHENRLTPDEKTKHTARNTSKRKPQRVSPDSPIHVIAPDDGEPSKTPRSHLPVHEFQEHQPHSPKNKPFKIKGNLRKVDAKGETAATTKIGFYSTTGGKIYKSADNLERTMHNLDFTKHIPRKPFGTIQEPGRFARSYNVNIEYVKGNLSKLCLPFNKTLGRDTKKKDHKLGSEGYYEVLDYLAHKGLGSKGGTAETSSYNIQFEKIIPRYTDAKSPLPSFMQKGSHSRFYVEQVGEAPAPSPLQLEQIKLVKRKRREAKAGKKARTSKESGQESFDEFFEMDKKE